VPSDAWFVFYTESARSYDAANRQTGNARACENAAMPSPIHPLDNPVWHALSGPQRGFAQGADGEALRYDPEFSIFSALPDEPSAASWKALAALVGADGVAVMARTEPLDAPARWQKSWSALGLQMIAEPTRDAPGAVSELGPSDVPEMLDLVARTEPGPFTKRTIELGAFFGLRIGGALAAMAGQRMRLDGYVEVSGVCTDPAYRGRGYAAVLVRAAMASAWPGAPILHVRDDNHGAIRVYERLGFSVRRRFEVAGYQAPPA
jgi:ribosomal protein S18 acetylase RimI-like enzyme